MAEKCGASSFAALIGNNMPKLLFAPMATLSHEAMRRIIEYYSPCACDEYYTEMIQATTFIGGGKFEQFYVRPGPCPERVVWQLTCGKAEPMAQAAKIIAGLGGIGIDINMGCCAPEIVRQGAGIAWMLKERAETENLLRLVRKAVPENMRLSVKMRLGDEDYKLDELLSFADMLAAQGVSQIVLHPRTRKAKFKRPPHWNDAQKLFEHLEKHYGNSICRCINGDIVDFQSLCSVQKLVPLAEGFMIGRAAVQKPWLFGDLARQLAQASAGQSAVEQLEVAGLAGSACLAAAQDGANACAEECADGGASGGAQSKIDSLEIVSMFIDNLVECQPEEFWLSRAQRFFSYFCKNYSFANYLFTQVNNAKNLPGMKQAFEAYFEKMPNERFLYRGH